MYSALRPLLFRLDPERAHELVVKSLKLFQSTPPLLGLLRTLNRLPPAPVEVAGLKFRNPVGLAAGFDKDAELLPALAALGFGFIEAGTVTLRPQPGNPKPRIFRYPAQEALVNRLGFNNRGAEDAARRLEKMPKLGIPLGINVGKNAATALEDAPQEYAACVALLAPFADYLALNISSPNTADLRRMHEPDRLRALLDAVLAKTGNKPVFLKVSPDLGDGELGSVARLVVERRVGLIATNTTVDRSGLPGLETGGLSGKPLKERALSSLRRLKELTGGKVPIIGVGGIFSAKDAKERMECGADLIQVYTGFIYKGPAIVREIVEDLVMD